MRMMDHSPWTTKPRKRKTSKTRPASWKYLRLSVSLIEGKPAKMFFFLIKDSDMTIMRPPITERFLRKKFKSKMRPYPKPCITTTANKPPTAKTACWRLITKNEHANITTTLITKKEKARIQKKWRCLCKYHIWSFHCVTILKASSMKVTTMRNLPNAGRCGFKPWVYVSIKSSNYLFVS